MQKINKDQPEVNLLKSGNQEHQRKVMSKLQKDRLMKKNLLESKKENLLWQL